MVAYVEDNVPRIYETLELFRCTCGLFQRVISCSVTLQHVSIVQVQYLLQSDSDTSVLIM